MGKKAPPKPEPQETEVPEKPTVVRKGKKHHKQASTLSTSALVILIFVVCGGAIIPFLDFFLRK